MLEHVYDHDSPQPVSYESPQPVYMYLCKVSTSLIIISYLPLQVGKVAFCKGTEKFSLVGKSLPSLSVSCLIASLCGKGKGNILQASEK